MGNNILHINWTKRGRKRFLDRQDWIERESCSRETALAWGRKILKATEHLTDFPNSRRIVPEINQSNIRELIVDGEFRIIYKVHSTSCDILSVRRVRESITSIHSL